MKNRVEPEVSLIDFKTIKENVERRLHRRRSRSSPSTESMIKEEDMEKDERFASLGTEVGIAPGMKRWNHENVEGISQTTVYKQRKRSEGVNEGHLGSYTNKQQRKGNVTEKNKSQDDETADDFDKHEGKAAQGVQRYHSVKKAASKWMHLRSSQREIRQALKKFEVLNLRELFEGGFLKKRGKLINDVTGILDEDIDGLVLESDESSDERTRLAEIKSKELIHYFVSLAKNKDREKTVNLDFVEALIKDGADPNRGDKYGQTVLHEVARVWHPDVARFLMERGNNVKIVCTSFSSNVTCFLHIN